MVGVEAHPRLVRLARQALSSEAEILQADAITVSPEPCHTVLMLDVLHKEHSFSDLLVAFLVVRNSQIQADLVDQLFNSAEKRLARALLLLTRFGKEDRLEPVLPRMSAGSAPISPPLTLVSSRMTEPP